MRCAIVGFLALLLGNAQGATAREGPSLDELLSRPPTPGVVTLLVAYADDPRTEARVAEALANPDPMVRGAAARVINVGAIVSAADALQKALKVEQEPRALLEEGRALVALGGASSRALVMDAVSRLRTAHENDLAQALVATFVNGSGAPIKKEFGELANVTSSPATWKAITAAAVRDDPGSLAALSNALLAAGNAGGWQGMLAAVHELRKPLPEPSVIAALRSGTPDIQTITCWYVAVDDVPLTEAMRVAISTTPGDPAASACGRLRRLESDGSNRKAVIAKARAEVPSEVGPVLRGLVAPPAKPVSTSGRRFAAIQMAGGYPPGVSADIAQAAGCELPAAAALGGGVLTYGDRGRAQSGAVVATQLPSQCVAAERALVLTALTPSDRLPVAGTSELVLLRMDRDGVECLAGQTARQGDIGTPVRVGEHGVTPPPKTRDVRPTYPVSAMKAGTQGIVVMEATIGTTGCIEAASVLRGIDDALDVSAIDAVSQWRFTPTLMNGQAVPVTMMVTVQFTLK